jgi:LuxR family maltose regulon positive regulatory protein
VLAHLPTDHFFHCVSGVVTGLALLRQSRLAEAEQTLTRAVAEAYANRALYFVVSGLARLGIVAVERGAFALAAQRYEEAIAACRGGQGVLSPIAGMALVGLGRLRGLQGRVDDGIQLLEQALTLCEQLNAAPFFFLDGHTGLAELYATSGRVPEALQQLARAEERLRRFANPVFLDTIAAYRASIWRAQADPAFVTWLRAHRMAVNVHQAEVRDKEYVTRIRGLIDTGQGEAALELIAELAAFARTMGRVRSRVDLDVLCAIALAHQGDARAAQVALNQALELAAPMGYISIFLEEGAPMVALLEAQSARRKAQSDPLQHFSVQLLAAFGRTAGAQRDGEPAGVRSALGRSNALLEPLTARELEVLRLVADGASNGEIARRLIVSIGTVKKHTANIFGKLEVQSRTQAVARARALGLL